MKHKHDYKQKPISKLQMQYYKLLCENKISLFERVCYVINCINLLQNQRMNFVALLLENPKTIVSYYKPIQRSLRVSRYADLNTKIEKALHILKKVPEAVVAYVQHLGSFLSPITESCMACKILARGQVK